MEGISGWGVEGGADVGPGIVMPGLVPGIHVFVPIGASKTWTARHRRAEATPSFGRLSPAMTN